MQAVKWAVAKLRGDEWSEDFSLLFAFLLVTFSWLFRGPLLSRKTVFGPFSLLFRGFFVAPVLGEFYAYSPWNILKWGTSRRPQPQRFPKSTAIQMGAFCNTNARRTAIRMGGVPRYEWEAYCDTNGRSTESI